MAHCLSNLRQEHLPEAAAQPVRRDLDCALGRVEPAGYLGIGRGAAGAPQSRLQRIEQRGANEHAGF